METDEIKHSLRDALQELDIESESESSFDLKSPAPFHKLAVSTVNFTLRYF